MKQCPAKEECLALLGTPMGMYHCPYCEEMIIAGLDPSDICPMINKKNKENDNG